MNRFVKASALCISLLKELEGWSSKAYKDGADKWTIGYGHLIKEGEGYLLNATISKVKGEELLLADLEDTEDAISRTVDVPMTQGMVDCLVCFVFNIGEGQWAKSTTLKILNSGQYDKIPDRIRMWNKITVDGEKVVSKGLFNRREREVKLWLGE